MNLFFSSPEWQKDPSNSPFALSVTRDTKGWNSRYACAKGASSARFARREPVHRFRASCRRFKSVWCPFGATLLPQKRKGALQNLVRFLINIPSCPFEKSIKALFTANYFICITKQLSTSPRPPHWKFWLVFIHFFNIVGLTAPPPPGNSHLFCGVYFWNCTL